jgi:hypothetical protein
MTGLFVSVSKREIVSVFVVRGSVHIALAVYVVLMIVSYSVSVVVRKEVVVDARIATGSGAQTLLPDPMLGVELPLDSSFLPIWLTTPVIAVKARKPCRMLLSKKCAMMPYVFDSTWVRN